MIGKMTLYKLICILILVILQCYRTEETFLTAITVAKTVWEVTKLAISVAKFIDEQKSDGDISNKELLKEIDSSIESAKTYIVTSVMEISKYQEIDVVVKAVHSSLIDLRKILEAKDNTTAKRYQEDFVEHYKLQNVVMHVRYLPKMLSPTIPGQNYELLTNLTEKTRCNLTALAVFADFYLDLVSNGIALEVLYNRLTNSEITPTQVIEDEWAYGLRKIQAELDKAEQPCIARFPELARADFKSSTSGLALFQNNEQRYIYNWTDVMFYSAKVEGYRFHYRKYASDILFYESTPDQNKVAVVGSRKDRIEWETSVAKELKKTSFAILPRDNYAAMRIGETMERKIMRLGYSFAAIVVYFEGSEFPEKEMKLDEDSTAAALVTIDIQLEYCSTGGLWCFDADDAFHKNGRKSVLGAFKVFVYPHAETGLTYTTGGSSVSKSSLAAILSTLWLLVCIL